MAAISKTLENPWKIHCKSHGFAVDFHASMAFIEGRVGAGTHQGAARKGAA